jgi:plastocyanin
LAAGLLVGGAIGLSAAAAPGQRPHVGASKRCHPRKHHPCPKPCHPRKHHKCPKARRRPKPPVTTTTSTTTTRTTGTTTTTTTTTTPPPLPSRLEVDENDLGQLPQPYSLTPSHNPVAAGKVEFNVYNFGMDDHTFAIKDSAGHQVGSTVKVPAGQAQRDVIVGATLGPGTYTLYCTLKAGQPDSHFTLGMHATLTVN